MSVKRVTCPACGNLARVRRSGFFYKHASVYGSARLPGANNPANFCHWSGEPAEGYSAALRLGIVANRSEFDALGLTDDWTPGASQSPLTDRREVPRG